MTQRKEASFVSVITAIGLASTALGGGMYVGALASDVETLKEEKEKVTQIQKDVQANTVVLAGMTVQQAAIIKEQAKQDKKLDRILDKLEEL